MTDQVALDQKAINTIRFLSADAVQKANSGHPGTPMGAATIAYTLWDRILSHDPNDPSWPNRDRFVLSAGHASMLLYSLLHLTGYDLSLDEIRNFRQWGSRTPGHPERGYTPGVEMTTGPLGQGLSHAVGMAIAEAWLGEKFNRPGHSVVDHHTYVLASDGDMQEGVSSEACSLAGTLRLGRLICLYDDNDIQIEGSTDIVFTENVASRFEAYGWHVIGPLDGFDVSAIEAAVLSAQAEVDRPSLVILKTVIGYGSPAQGTAKVHGEPLGEENLLAAKQKLGWPTEPAFLVPDDVLAHMRRAIERGRTASGTWKEKYENYERAHPDLASRLQAQLAGDLNEDWDSELDALFPPGTAAIATRSASGKVLNALVKSVPNLVGGSADLAPSNKTNLGGHGDFGWTDYGGHNMHFGVREHAMGAIAGGMALHGGIIPYVATFLTFSDYMRPPIRLAAMMGLRVVYVYTHDSIGLGEDGPTHQPVEQLMSLRCVPNLNVMRPADATETAQAWRTALMTRHGPTALVLTRQNLPVIDRTRYAPADGANRGAYVLWESHEETPDLILIGTGSEMHVALEAGERLAASGVSTRVVSMPSWELFDSQPDEYRESVLPSNVRARVSVEAGVTVGWEHYVGLDGVSIGLDRFGASAPAGTLMKKFGFTVGNVVERSRALLAGQLSRHEADQRE